MATIISKIHIFVLLWLCYTIYLKFSEHNDQIEVLNGQIPVLQNQINRKKKLKEDLKNYYADIEDAKARIEKVAVEIEKLQQQLPSGISDAENLDIISGIANKLNIKEPFLSPGAEEEKGFYFTKKYHFKGRGTYLQFLIFMEKIGSLERILNIDSFKFLKSAEKQKGRFQAINGEIDIVAYRYNQSYKEDRGIEEIEKKFKEGVKNIKKTIKKVNLKNTEE